MKHVMHDLETLGLTPGCVAFSIGAVEFDPHAGTMGKEFYTVVNVDSCLDAYLREEEGTKAWWEKQSDEAQIALDQARRGDGFSLHDALGQFNDWLKDVSKSKKDIRLYGNGADFDNPILKCMYDAAGMEAHLYDFGGRCYRTLKNLDELFGEKFKAPKLARSGTYHNALDDAKTQARHLMDIVAAINCAA